MIKKEIILKGEVCKLCRTPAQLMRSHILPEFFYAPVYDDLHRTLFIASNEKERFIQKGIRERLLCQNCETKLSRYEGYAIKIIQDIPNFDKDSSGKFIYRDNVDYKLFKLFQLSILWRSSVSKEKMFANVNLAKHEELLRLMLKNENPGKTTDYGCFVLRIPNTQKVHRIIMPPMPERLYGHNGTRFMTGSLFWYFITSSHPIQKDVSSMFLQESGVFIIWTAPWNEQQVYENVGKLFRTRKIK